MTTEQQVQDILHELLDVLDDPDFAEDFDFSDFNFRSVNTYSDNGVLTNNKGLVIRMQDMSEFQITIVKSR